MSELGIEEQTVNVILGSADAERQIAQATALSAIPWQDQRKLIPARELHGLKIIDIGSGISDVVARLLEEGADAYGIDPNYEDLSQLKQKSNNYLMVLRQQDDASWLETRQKAAKTFWDSVETTPEHYLTAFATKLPFPDKSTDIIYSNGAIFPYIALDWKTLVAVVNECIRITKPGGYISINPYEGHSPPQDHLETIRHPNERKLVALLQGDKKLKVEIKKIPVGNWDNHRSLLIRKLK